MPTPRTFDELTEGLNLSDPLSWRSWEVEAIRNARQAWFQRHKAILDKAQQEGRDLLASEQRELDKCERELEQLADLVERRSQALEGMDPMPPSRALHASTHADPTPALLAPEQRLASKVASSDGEPLRFGALIRAMVTGRKDGLSDDERRALSEGVDAAGGFLVPDELSAEIIDRARAASVAIRAGARTVNMETDQVTVAKVTGDPSPGWRAENAAIPESDATFGSVVLNAHTLGVITRMSRELVEDARNIEDLVRDIFASAFALKVDYAILRGSGTAEEPQGVRNASGVTITNLATDGRAPTYDDLVDAVGRLNDANESPSAAIWHPRTGRTFAKKVDSTGQPLEAPSLVSEQALSRHQSTQVPINLTTGLNADTSEIYVGDFAMVALGVRTELRVELLRERYSDLGQIALLGWYRADVAVLRGAAFNVLTGVRP